MQVAYLVLDVGVVDMGGSTSNIVIHSGNSIRYNDFLGVGSNHITNDLSMALHTPLNVADSVKMQYGSLHAPNNDLIELPIIGDPDDFGAAAARCERSEA